MDLRSKGSTSEGEGSGVKSCVECKATKTPLWRTGPAGPKSLCNACGIRLKKRLASEAKVKRNDLPVKKKNMKPRTQKARPTASISTICSTTNPATGKSTSTTAKSAPPPPASGKSTSTRVKSASLPAVSAFGNDGGDGNTGGNGNAGCVHRRYFFRVRFIGNKQRVVKKLRCFQRRRTNFRRTGFYFLNRNGRTMAEVEQAAVLALLSLSGGSSPA